MPNKTTQAINWALNQYVEDENETILVKESDIINKRLLVKFVRDYFNVNHIEYSTFSYEDLEPLLN